MLLNSPGHIHVCVIMLVHITGKEYSHILDSTFPVSFSRKEMNFSSLIGKWLLHSTTHIYMQLNDKNLVFNGCNCKIGFSCTAN